MQIQLQEGVTCTCIHTDKFKDLALSIHFLAPLSEKNATERSLLALMLSDRCAKYDTKVKMNQIMDDLYSASLSARCVGFGQMHALEIRSKIINPCYIQKNNNLLNDWLNLIHEVIFHPLKTKNEFSMDLILESKRLLEAKIQRKLDDTPTYAVLKAFEIAGQDQPLSITPQGSLACLEKVNGFDLYEQYVAMLYENPIEIMICGQFDEKQMITMIQEKLPFMARKKKIQTYYAIKDTEYREEIITRNQNQSNVARVYATHIQANDSLYPALKIANGIFGQYPSSYLFQVVREKHSLCYHIASSLVSYDAAMILTTGIETENIDQTLHLCDELLAQCQKGQFDDELFNTTKNMQIHALKASLDNMNSMLSYTLNQRLLNRNCTIEEHIHQIEEVTREQVIEAFAQIQPIASCIVKGVGEHE